MKFPWLRNPNLLKTERWHGNDSNEKMARKVLETQCRLPEEKRKNIDAFMGELYKRGTIKPFEELSKEWQQIIKNAGIWHYYCYRCVDNPGSITTPHRVVVDPTMSGMNEFLPKGSNNMNKLLELLIDFRCHRVGYSYDISKMYNGLKVLPEALNYQLFLWKPKLEMSAAEQLWLFVAGMYGVICTGNQATEAIRRAAGILAEKYPLGAFAILYRQYVDDGFAGANSIPEAKEIFHQGEEILDSIGFGMKVVSYSGEVPTEKASKDGVVVSVGGYKWMPVEDCMKLGMGEINFHKKQRGSKKPNPIPVVGPEDLEGIWPSEWSRRKILSKYAEQWDLVGISEPVRVDWKLALKTMNGMGWDAQITGAEIEVWKEKIRDIFKTQEIKWSRCIIPQDAVDPIKIRLINANDGSPDVAASGVWAGVERKNGEFSCQLIFAKSRVCSQTVPRNELDGCVLGTAATEICRRALGEKCGEVIRVTDSSVTLCWISNLDIQLKQFTFNRVKEIIRWSEPTEWFHCAGDLNPADKATRPGMKAEEIGEESVWRCGFPWMKARTEDLTLQRYENFAPMHEEDREAVEKEMWTLPELKLILTNSSPDDQEIIRRMRQVVHKNRDMKAKFPPKTLNVGGGKLFYLSTDTDLKKVQSSVEPKIVVDLVEDITGQSKVKEINVPRVSVLSLSDERQQETGIHFVETKPDEENVYIMDPIFRGWNSSLTVTKVIFHFINAAYHAAHQRKTCKCREAENCSGGCFKVRENMAKNCQICQKAAEFLKEWDQGELMKRWAKAQKRSEVHFSCASSCALSIIQNHGSTLVTRGEAARQKEKENKKPVKEYGKRKKACLCKPMCKRKGCLDWDLALLNAKVGELPSRKALRYWARVATKEVKSNLPRTSPKKSFYTEEDGVLYYGGRLQNVSEFEIQDLNIGGLQEMNKKFNFCRPVILGTSPLAYALAIFGHWELTPHAGVEYSLFKLLQTFHITNARFLMTKIRQDCRRCRFMLLRTLRVEMSSVSQMQVTLAPSFYAAQVDMAGPFFARQGRSKVKLWAVIFVCCLTSAVSIQVAEDYSTKAFVSALLRHSSRYGYPCHLLPDRGSQLVSGSEGAKFDFRDLQQVLHKDRRFTVSLSAVKSHEEHGKVERKIQVVRRILERMDYTGIGLSILDFQTFFYSAANSMNNVPMAVSRNVKRGSRGGILETICPNSLLLGRNNEREPTGYFTYSSEPAAIKNKNEALQEAFYKILMSSIHLLIPRQKMTGKWGKGHPKEKKKEDNHYMRPLVIGDVVLFKKDEGFREGWHFGRVISNPEGRWRKVVVEYQLAEAAWDTTVRAERDLRLIQGIDDIDMNTEAHQLAIAADMAYKRGLKTSEAPQK